MASTLDRAGELLATAVRALGDVSGDVEAARELGAGVAYISTDAVFDGKKAAPYVETDPALPPTVYGRTKLRGEQIARSLPRHWIFRVSVLFGPGKTNFVEKGLRKIAAGERYLASADQMGSALSGASEKPARLSKIVNCARGARGTRLPLIPVARGGAPVIKDANPGAVFAGKPAMTSSATAPPLTSLARLGSLPARIKSSVNSGTMPSQARMIALVAV